MQISEHFYHEIPGTGDFVPVVDVNYGGGYEWDEFHAWYSPSRRRYFWASGSGCSCDYFGSLAYKIDDFETGDRDALVAAVRAYHTNSYRAKGGDDLDSISKVRAFTVPDEEPTPSTLAARVDARLRAEWPGTRRTDRRGDTDVPPVTPGGLTDALILLAARVAEEEAAK